MDPQPIVMIENVVWVASLIAPLLAAAITGYLLRRPNAPRLRIGFVGALGAIILGAIGTYVAGETILGAIMGNGDIPFHLVAQAWHRMWYPLGLGLAVGVGLALFSLVDRSAA